ncbi:MAG TPA: hypothetical protein VKY37_07900 [Brumimicrobium sp.]|nr:hypothetical protein [Brumimicrobium sp.]
MKIYSKFILLLSFTPFIMNTSTYAQKSSPAFKIYTNDNKQIMKVNKKGVVKVMGKKSGVLRADGVLTSLKNDTLVFIDSQGILYSKELLPFAKIDENGTIEFDKDKKLEWTSEGNLQVRESNFIRVEPNLKEHYADASLLFLVYATMMTSSIEFVEVEGAEYDTTESEFYNQNEEQMNSEDQLPNVSKIVFGSVKSGTLNGSLQNEVFPTEYSYSHYDATIDANKEFKADFDALIQDYYDNTIVNDTISLREYLTLLRDNNEESLKVIHDKSYGKMAKGKSIYHLPILIYSDDLNTPYFTVDYNSLDMKGVGVSNLHEFINQHAQHFSSEVPDEFYNTHYSNKY